MEQSAKHRIDELIDNSEFQKLKAAVNELVILAAVIEKLRYVSSGGLLN